MDDSSTSTSAKIIRLPHSGVTDGEEGHVRLRKSDAEQEAQEEAWASSAQEARTEASFKNPPRILEIEMFNKGECETVKSIVLSLQPYWISRGMDTFWTIGASTYNDLIIPTDDHPSYYEVAEQNNIIIQRSFGPLLTSVKETIGKIYQRECIDLPFAGLMGFHIFNDTALEREHVGGHIHTDEPFQRILWTEPFANPFSFTLAIALPDDAGGLDYWDENNKRHYQPYKIGHMYIHSGRFPHRIGSHPFPSNEKPRITLQGHGATLLDTNRVAVYF